MSVSQHRPLGEEVGGHRLSVAAVSGAGPPPVLLSAAQALRSHQTSAAAFARARARLPQVYDQARRPVGAPTGRVRGRDLRGEGRVLALPGSRQLLALTVVAAGRDAQQIAQQADRVLASHRFDLGIPLSGVSERMPNDFFRMFSRSRIRITSARKRSFSFTASASVCGAGPPSPGRGAYNLRHS